MCIQHGMKNMHKATMLYSSVVYGFSRGCKREHVVYSKLYKIMLVSLLLLLCIRF